MFNLFYFTRKTNWEISVMRLASRFAPLPRFECRRWLLTSAVSIKHQVASYVVNLGSSWGALGDCLCNNLNTVPNITFREEEREVSGAIWNKMPPWMRQAGKGRGGSHWCRNHIKVDMIRRFNPVSNQSCHITPSHICNQNLIFDISLCYLVDFFCEFVCGSVRLWKKAA